VMYGIDDLFKCPFGEDTQLSCYRVEGGEDECQPFTILCDCAPGLFSCKYRCSFSAKYDFNNGLENVSCECNRNMLK